MSSELSTPVCTAVKKCCMGRSDTIPSPVSGHMPGTTVNVVMKMADWNISASTLLVSGLAA